MNPIRLYLADDHQIMREGLRLVLAREPDFAIVGEVGDGAVALGEIEALNPDLAVLDVEMPGLSGIELAERLQKSRPTVRVLILSAHAEAQFVQEALRVGVEGFMVKASAAVDLVRAIRAIHGGATFFCPRVSTVLAQELRRRNGQGPSQSPLSDRETEILRRIAEGQSTKEIAYALGISARTIEAHRAHLMAKLGIFSAAGLTKFALREGLTTL